VLLLRERTVYIVEYKTGKPDGARERRRKTRVERIILVTGIPAAEDPIADGRAWPWTILLRTNITIRDSLPSSFQG
jgi:hypothetical protein